MESCWRQAKQSFKVEPRCRGLALSKMGCSTTELSKTSCKTIEVRHSTQPRRVGGWLKAIGVSQAMGAMLK